MTPIEPLLAQGVDDLIGIILVILFVVVPLIGQFISKMNKPGGPPAGRAGGGGRPAQAAGGQAPKGIAEEIGDFLRRAAQEGGVQAGRPQVRGEAPRPRQIRAERQPIVRPVVAGQPVEAQLVDRAHREDVEPAIDTGDIARQTSKLGRRVVQAEEQFDKKSHDVFSHEVSDLAKQPSRLSKKQKAAQAKRPPTALPATSAAGFAALLSDTRNIRQAIVIHEILARPLDRWQ